MMFKWWSSLNAEQREYYQYQENLNHLQSNNISVAGDNTFYPDTFNELSFGDEKSNIENSMGEWLLKYLDYLQLCGGEVTQETLLAARDWLKRAIAYLRGIGLLPLANNLEEQGERQQQQPLVFGDQDPILNETQNQHKSGSFGNAAFVYIPDYETEKN